MVLQAKAVAQKTRRRLVTDHFKKDSLREAIIVNKKKMSRRNFLLTTAGAGLALLAASSRTPTLLAQGTATPMPSATPLPLPEGGAGKLTVIHKTEYFVDVQNLFRKTVTDFAAKRGVQLDISTANPELFGDFTAKMVAAVQAGNPPDLGYHTLSIPQMYSQNITEDVSDVVDKAVSLYGDVLPATAADNAKFDGKWWAVPFMCTTAGW